VALFIVLETSIPSPLVIEDLAGLEAVIGPGDGMGHAGLFTFHVVVAAISRFVRNGEQRILKDRPAMGFDRIRIVEEREEVGEFSHFHENIRAKLHVRFAFAR
jgi:hypothetical protein